MKNSRLITAGIAIAAALLCLNCGDNSGRSPSGDDNDANSFVNKFHGGDNPIIDPCAANQYADAACPACAVASPPTQCPNYVAPDPCAANQYASASCPACAVASPPTQCPNYVAPDPCAANQYADASCPACAVANPPSQCPNYVAPDPCAANQYASASCPACAVASPPSQCPNYVPLVTGPCDNGASPECCVAQPSYSGCTGKFCRWNADPADCHPIGTYNAEAALRTESACKSNYGEVVNSCSVAYTGKYCYWANLAVGERCVAMPNPNDVDPYNPGQTYLQNCTLSATVFSTLSECNAHTPSNKYCYWKANECWIIINPSGPCNTSGGPCSGTQLQHCQNTGTVITCSGTDRPGNGVCCNNSSGY